MSEAERFLEWSQVHNPDTWMPKGTGWIPFSGEPIGFQIDGADLFFVSTGGVTKITKEMVEE